MRLFILGLICMISPFLGSAHNPLSARYHLEAGEHASLLTINLSQTGINQALLKIHSADRLLEINQNELKELIVYYIKTNFNFSVDGRKIKLEKGGIKLGSHQTDLKFVLPGFSKIVERIDIHIPAFSENEQHQTIFSYHLNNSDEHIILNATNNYQSTIMLQNSDQSYSWHWLIVPGIVCSVFIFILGYSIIPKERLYPQLNR